MGEYEKSEEFKALISKYEWLKFIVGMMEKPNSGSTGASKARSCQRLLGGLDLLYSLAQAGKLDDDYSAIERVYYEARNLYRGYGTVIAVPVNPGDTVYDVCPPCEGESASICDCTVEEVSEKHIFVSDTAIPNGEIGKTIFTKREDAEEYIKKMWGWRS